MYGNEADFIAYSALRGRSAPAGPATTQALVRASDYIRTRYVARLAPAYDIARPEVIEATYIAASYELDKPGFWSTTFTPGEATKILTRVKDIQWAVVGGGGSSGDMVPISPAIEGLFYAHLLSSIGPRVV